MPPQMRPQQLRPAPTTPPLLQIRRRRLLPPRAKLPLPTSSNDTASAASPQPTAPPSIPLIQFQDVPITTAIENLARQAGINYLIDPKIGYGQPDQNGQIKPEPTLSIRWENVTAEQALLALLDNYGLQLNSDRKSQIARITTKDPIGADTAFHPCHSTQIRQHVEHGGFDLSFAHGQAQQGIAR